MSIFRRKSRNTVPSAPVEPVPLAAPAAPATTVPEDIATGAGVSATVDNAANGLLARIESRIDTLFRALTTRLTSDAAETVSRLDQSADTLGALVSAVDDIRGAVDLIGTSIRESDAAPVAPAPETVPQPEPQHDISFDEENPDERFAGIIRRYVGLAPSSSVSGELVELTAVGRLKNGAIAWFNEERSMFGTVTRDQLGEMEPETDDRFRARVVSYPWGHVILGVVPQSLVSPYAARPVTGTTIDSAGTPPESVKGTPFERLRPGDIVLARVPYDGTSGPDRRGRIAKPRPSVFLRWDDGGYAWLRAIYDADGYVASNNLGIRLVDTSSSLDKASVVRNAEYDIDPANIFRHLGRLGQRDLNALNIEDTPVDDSPQDIQAPVNYDRPDLDPVTREIPTLIASVKPAAAVPTGELMDAMLTAFVGNDVLRATLTDEGIHYAMVGHVFATLARSGNIPVPKGTFRHLIDSRLNRGIPGGMHFEMRLDENNHPVLWLGNSQGGPTAVAPAPRSSSDDGIVPINRDEHTGEAPHNPRFVIDDEYEMPDVIIYDQESVSILMRERRVDLAEALSDLRAGGDAPAYVLGSDSGYGWSAFQQAARHRGWRTSPTESREEMCALAVRFAKEAQAEYVTVVGFHNDLIAELENNGFEVTIISNVA